MTPQDIDRLVATLDYDGIVKATAPLTEAELARRTTNVDFNDLMRPTLSHRYDAHETQFPVCRIRRARACCRFLAQAGSGKRGRITFTALLKSVEPSLFPLDEAAHRLIILEVLPNQGDQSRLLHPFGNKIRVSNEPPR